MRANLESFKPRLRSGRVIPQGSRIIFETDSPYNQIVLPIVLADFVLLCSGQFSVREIVEKIYKKQGSVQFTSMLHAIHVLHKGGFFENGEELELSSHLSTWVRPSKSGWHLSWSFGQRIISSNASPIAFYILTLALLLACIGGFQFFPTSPIEFVSQWFKANEAWRVFLTLAVVSSGIQSLRYFVKGAQFLLVTGKAYNVALRLSPWGLHLHVGDETNDLLENRLYTSMFHVSQIIIGWAAVWVSALWLSSAWLEPMIIVSIFMTAWELNPFVHSEGRKLIRDLLLPSDREVVSWHFESDTLLSSMNPDLKRREDDYARICRIWGSLWLLMVMVLFHESLNIFGSAVNSIMQGDWTERLIGAGVVLSWVAALALSLVNFWKWILAPMLRPGLGRFKARLKQVTSSRVWAVQDLARKLESLPVFAHFQDQFLERLLVHSQILEAKPGATIIRQGDPSRDLYALLEGQVEIVRTEPDGHPEWLSELNAVAIFGEASLVDNAPRAAHVISTQRSYVLRVPIHIIRDIAQESQSVRHLEDCRNAILVHQFFASSPVFRSLTKESIDFLSSRGSLEYFDKDEVVFSQGDVGDSLYLILRGTVDVEVYGTQVKQLRQGSFFGEIALIANVSRTATIRAAEPSVFFRLSSDSFWEILVQHIDLGVFIETVSENRLREDLELAKNALRTTG